MILPRSRGCCRPKGLEAILESIDARLRPGGLGSDLPVEKPESALFEQGKVRFLAFSDSRGHETSPLEWGMDEGYLLSFDLDGTLVDHGFSTAVWREAIPALVAKKQRIPLEAAKGWVYEQYEKVGEGSLEWYDLAYWHRRFGLEEDWRDTLKEHRRLIHLFPEVPEVLQALARIHHMIILSNASRPFIQEELSQSVLREIPFLHVISATSDLGQVKNTSAFYREVCRALGLDPSRLIHVGDHKEFDYIAPTKAGIKAYFLDRSGREKGDHVVTDLRGFAEKALDGD